ncbi:hypothetical protein LXL04_032735 [Taraxacum kok-saghyz]
MAAMHSDTCLHVSLPKGHACHAVTRVPMPEMLKPRMEDIGHWSKLPAIKQVTGTLGRACRNEPTTQTVESELNKITDMHVWNKCVEELVDARGRGRGVGSRELEMVTKLLHVALAHVNGSTIDPTTPVNRYSKVNRPDQMKTYLAHTPGLCPQRNHPKSRTKSHVYAQESTDLDMYSSSYEAPKTGIPRLDARVLVLILKNSVEFVPSYSARRVITFEINPEEEQYIILRRSQGFQLIDFRGLMEMKHQMTLALASPPVSSKSAS